MRQWSFYCKLKLCNGIRASEHQGDWRRTPREIHVSDMFYSSWFGFFCWNIVTWRDHHWSQPVKLLFLLWYCCYWLLVDYSADLFLLCCLISKDLPCAGSQSQLGITTTSCCMHPRDHIGFFLLFLLLRRQTSQQHFYMLKDVCRAI